MISLNPLPIRAKLLKASLLAIAAIGVAFPGVSGAQVSSEMSDKSDTSASETARLKGSAAQTVLEDGTYLFGQSPNPDQNGSDYIVFSVKNNQTVGAFYQPSSSFDCFSGEISPNRLSVEIVESYTRETYPYAVAVTLDEPLVAGEAASAYLLKGFHQIEALSVKDQEILAVCQADLAQ